MTLPPANPPTHTTIPTGVQPSADLVPAPVSNRPVIQLTGGSTLALIAGGTTAVLVVGTVLVSMLLAVAITAASVAVVAVVLRSLLNHHDTNR
ncbi:SpdD protein [Streptomyces sp. SL13]|uniref:SpdD protein n=1 Tax=Streptantibioticus silvisoli TaxID=2705255 RepID=A0AA90H1V1_9ACTN|nr:SpdD protein [Streptantibioticus silvisoli]MDI5968642.1 SpdD protein [Streptantibioticus silvisoli]